MVVSAPHHYFGRIEDFHLQVHAHLAEMVLRPPATESTYRGSNNRRRLAHPGAITVWARCPIDRVFQTAGNRIIVFRSREQNTVRRANFLLQLGNLRWWITL